MAIGEIECESLMHHLFLYLRTVIGTSLPIFFRLTNRGTTSRCELLDGLTFVIMYMSVYMYVCMSVRVCMCVHVCPRRPTL